MGFPFLMAFPLYLYRAFASVTASLHIPSVCRQISKMLCFAAFHLQKHPFSYEKFMPSQSFSPSFGSKVRKIVIVGLFGFCLFASVHRVPCETV